MILIVNGNDIELNDELTVSGLLIAQEVKMPEMISVELNGQILKRSQFENIKLNDGDKVEFLYFMGGGSVIN